MDTNFYDRYYEATQDSPLHSQFCKYVFDIDLCQHGFTSLRQLGLLIEIAGIKTTDHVIDIGCGSGMITEYLQQRTGAWLTGVDNEMQAIRQARRRTRDKGERLSYLRGDINNLSLQPGAYDVVLLIDSIYFSTDYEQTIDRLAESLSPRGCILIFYSIGPALLGTRTFPSSLLEADQTPLAQALSSKGFSLRHRDLTGEDYELAKRRKAFLETRRQEFEEEGIGFIWENRMGDSEGIIEAVQAGLHRRYLYCARMVEHEGRD